MTDVLKVLSIDGGGIRGVIPATILAEIESRTHARIAELFDLVAGTSTGGILALGLVKPSAHEENEPEYAATDLVDLYAKEGRHIFDRSLWHHFVALDNLLDEKYEAKGLESMLNEYFGDVPLSKAVTETLVTTTSSRRGSPGSSPATRHATSRAGTSRCASWHVRPRPRRRTSSPRR